MIERVDVVGFGIHTLDLIGVIEGHPEPDTKAALLRFDHQGGGVTATALVTCSRLGLRTRYLGKVGVDFWARAALRTLRQEGVDVRHVLRAEASPGHVSLVLVDRSTGARTLFSRRPSDYAVGPNELDRMALTAGQLLHIDGIDAEAALQAIHWARAAEMRITMDGERIVPGIEGVWPLVDVLVCNQRFLTQVTRCPGIEDGLRALAQSGPTRVAVTLGHEGVVGLAEDRILRVPSFSVAVVDTNGAGDVFHGAVAFGELRKWPFEDILIFASAVAAMKCRALGGRRGIPRVTDVRDFLVMHGRSDVAGFL